MEENTQATVETKETESNAEQAVDKKDIEETVSEKEQLAQMRVEMAKLKKALDKSSSETASYKKQLREKQSADEIAAQEKAEREALREEQYQALLKENTVNKYAKNFLALGYGEDNANKAALAQYEGDTDALFDIQKKVIESMQKDIKAELLKQMPVSHISNDNEVSITQEQFDKLTYLEQVEFKNKYPEVWKKYASN